MKRKQVSRCGTCAIPILPFLDPLQTTRGRRILENVRIFQTPAAPHKIRKVAHGTALLHHWEQASTKTLYNLLQPRIQQGFASLIGTNDIDAGGLTVTAFRDPKNRCPRGAFLAPLKVCHMPPPTSPNAKALPTSPTMRWGQGSLSAMGSL